MRTRRIRRATCRNSTCNGPIFGGEAAAFGLCPACYEIGKMGFAVGMLAVGVIVSLLKAFF